MKCLSYHKLFFILVSSFAFNICCSDREDENTMQALITTPPLTSADVNFARMLGNSNTISLVPPFNNNSPENDNVDIVEIVDQETNPISTISRILAVSSTTTTLTNTTHISLSPKNTRRNMPHNNNEHEHIEHSENEISKTHLLMYLNNKARLPSPKLSSDEKKITKFLRREGSFKNPVFHCSNLMRQVNNITLQTNDKNVNAKKYWDIKEHPLFYDYRRLREFNNIAAKLSQIVDNKFKEKKIQVICSLGQSPAYLLEMMYLRDQKLGRGDRKYINIAFSGNEESPGFNSPSAQTAYKKYLEDYLGKYLNDSRYNVVIIDYCLSGRGIASFLKLCDKFFNKRPECIILKSDTVDGNKIKIISNLEQNVFIIEKETFDYFGEGNWTLFEILGGDHFNDRLVANFPPEKWETVNPIDFQISEDAKSILSTLRNFVGKHVKRNSTSYLLNRFHIKNS